MEQELQAIAQSVGGEPLGIVLLIAWAELRLLPRVREAHALLRRVANKLGVVAEVAKEAAAPNPPDKPTAKGTNA